MAVGDSAKHLKEQLSEMVRSTVRQYGEDYVFSQWAGIGVRIEVMARLDAETGDMVLDVESARRTRRLSDGADDTESDSDDS